MSRLVDQLPVLPPPVATPPPPPPHVAVDLLPPPVDLPPPPATVTIATGLATVTVEACEPVTAVHKLARQAHVDAVNRAAAARAAERAATLGY